MGMTRDSDLKFRQVGPDGKFNVRLTESVPGNLVGSGLFEECQLVRSTVLVELRIRSLA